MHGNGVVHFIDFDGGAALNDLVENRAQMVGDAVGHTHGAAGNGAGEQIAACFDAVRNDGMVGAVERFHAFDADHAGACATNFCAHGVEEIGEIDDLWLFGGVFDGGGAFSKAGAHHQIFSRTNAWHAQENAVALQSATARHFCDDFVIADLDRRTEDLQTLQMQIDRTRTDGTATRQAQHSTSKARQKRPHNEHRSTHFFDIFYRRLYLVHRRSVDFHSIALECDVCAQRQQHIFNDLNIGQAWHIIQHTAALGQQCCDNDWQDRVFRTADANLTVQLAAPGNNDLIQFISDEADVTSFNCIIFIVTHS